VDWTANRGIVDWTELFIHTQEAGMTKSTEVISVATARGLVKEFVSGFVESQKARMENCKLLVRIIDSGTITKDEIADEYKIPVSVLSRIESIGRGQLHHELMYRYEKQYRLIGKMPIEEQGKILDKGVDVLTTSGVLHVEIEDLQLGQVNQVFNGTQIRSAAAQKAWIEDQKTTQEVVTARSRTSKADCGYRLKGDSLVVTTAQSFTRKQLLEILARM